MREEAVVAMDPNELVAILERAIANLPDQSAEGRRRVYERVEKTIRGTCTSPDGEFDGDRYRDLRRDLGAAIAIIERQARVAARSSIPQQPVAAPAPPPPLASVDPVPRRAAEPIVAVPAADPIPPLEYSLEEGSRSWVKGAGIGVLVLAMLAGGAYALLPGGPLNSMIGGRASAPTEPRPDVMSEGPRESTPPQAQTDVEPPSTDAEDETAAETPVGTDTIGAPPEESAFAPTPAEPRVTEVKVAILNGASAWRVEPLSGFDEDPDGPPVMALAQDRNGPLLVSLYCDTPELTVFRVAHGAEPDTLRRELGERGQLDGDQRQRIQVKTDRNEGFAGEFLALTPNSWAIRLAPDNIETLRAGKEIEISVNDTLAGTVSLSGATPAIDEALAGASCK